MDLRTHSVPCFQLPQSAPMILALSNPHHLTTMNIHPWCLRTFFGSYYSLLLERFMAFFHHSFA
ncbi:hypothetical protein RHMOL_Rhmol05G0165600 [Rhododendron molle]|uniref:Uncharacterized protein n=1 Tax=Rhododendron molle TaxID=49168 RepID=A0ACC0NQY6_RHOML|nr:hypothetical protein RHMOL_Rhmol05G0165600 [Rhododendron molle]